MSAQNPNYLMQNSSQNNSNIIECVPQISHISLAPNASSNSTPTTTSTVNSPRDSYSYNFISGLSIDITNTSDNNSDNLQSSASTLMSGSSNPLILTLEAPTMSRNNSVSSPIPPLILPNNEFSPNIQQNSHNIPVDNVRQNRPYLKILEEPTNRIRYRYRSEKGSHGGLTGENSSQNKKTYPSVKLENYHSSTQVYVRASLYTNEERPKSHVHKLMGRHCNEDGHCTVPVADNMIATFQNLGILFVGKKEVPEILFRRKLEDIQAINSSFIGEHQLSEVDKQRIREESEREAKDMNLNSVKICFEAFVYENDMSFAVCSPIYSRPVANQKSPDSGELKIVRMDKYCGPATGDEEVFLLCEKVNKKEIKIRFFETDSEGNQLWEAFGNFTEADVHHQVAIVFRTPPYRDPNIERSVQVYLQLFRPRDGEYSEARPFTYKPKENDLEGVERKRRKISHSYTSIGDIGANSGNTGFVSHSFQNLSDSSDNTQTARDNNNNNIGYYGHNNCHNNCLNGYSKRKTCLQNKSNNLNRNCGPNRKKPNLTENSNIVLLYS